MDRKYYKYMFNYDCEQNAYPEKAVIYKEVFQKNDNHYYYNKYGNFLKLAGPADYMEKLGCILADKYNSEITMEEITYEEFSKIFYSAG